MDQNEYRVVDYDIMIQVVYMLDCWNSGLPSVVVVNIRNDRKLSINAMYKL